MLTLCVCIGTNQKEFRSFLDQLKITVKPELQGQGRRKPLLLLDNHSAHKTLMSRKKLEKQFEPIFQPAHR